MARRALEVAAFLRAIDGVVALHLGVGLAVSVVVRCAVEQHTRPEEVARRLDGAEVAVLDVDAETAK